MKIAPDVDQLMWVLSEQNDRKAIEEFEHRFPDLRLELAKRVALVSNLRGAGRAVHTDKPRFHAPAPQTALWQRPAAVLAFAACLGILAFGAFFATRAMMPSPPPRQPAGQASGSLRLPTPTLPEPSVDPSQAPLAVAPAPKPLSVDPPAYVPKYQRRHAIAIEEAGLLSVLEAIATQTGMQVEVAPGVEDLRISCNYREATGLEMLQDLGTKFGFTALPQGGNRVLIVPVVGSGDGEGGGPMVPPVKGG